MKEMIMMFIGFLAAILIVGSVAIPNISTSVAGYTNYGSASDVPDQSNTWSITDTSLSSFNISSSYSTKSPVLSNIVAVNTVTSNVVDPSQYQITGNQFRWVNPTGCV